MASRIIHYAIAVLILQNTKPEAAREYENTFLAGSLAPEPNPIPHCPIEEVTLTDVNTQILTFTRDFLDAPAPLHIFHAPEIFQFIEETAKEITQLLPLS